MLADYLSINDCNIPNLNISRREHAIKRLSEEDVLRKHARFVANLATNDVPWAYWQIRRAFVLTPSERLEFFEANAAFRDLPRNQFIREKGKTFWDENEMHRALRDCKSYGVLSQTGKNGPWRVCSEFLFRMLKWNIMHEVLESPSEYSRPIPFLGIVSGVPFERFTSSERKDFDLVVGELAGALRKLEGIVGNARPRSRKSVILPPLIVLLDRRVELALAGDEHIGALARKNVGRIASELVEPNSLESR